MHVAIRDRIRRTTAIRPRRARAGIAVGVPEVRLGLQRSNEEEVFLGLSERWRNIPKPTIAEVQGKVIAGGLMLVWPCDLIVASHDAEFSDNVVAMGANAVEF
jgi:enoyl-CoA hydratase